MVRFTFKKGLRFLCGAKVYTLIRRLANGKFQLDDEDGQTITSAERELHDKWASGAWHIDEESLGHASSIFYYTTPKDLESLPERQREIAQRKHSYLAKIKTRFVDAARRFVSTHEALEPHIREVAKELGDADPPSPQTVWRWWKKFLPTQCITKLSEDRSRSGRKSDDVQRSVFDEAVAEVFLSPQKKPGKAVVDSVRNKYKRMNREVAPTEQIVPPSKSTMYRWMNQLYYEVVRRARQGKSATERELRSVMSGLKVARILQRIELDHTPLDILVICQLTRLVLGRPWLTLAIDRYSRMVVGFYISFHEPSATSVLYTLRMCIMPKHDILGRFPDVVGPWPASGIPDSIAVDNGMDLHAEAVKKISFDIGAELHYCGAGHPELKGGIERAIGRVNRELIHSLPGTTFSNPKMRGDYDSEGTAALDIETLTHIILKWIVDDYHKTPHRGMAGKTPLQVWNEGLGERTTELPAYPRQLDLLVGHTVTRTLFHYGLEYDNLRYNSPLLQSMRRRDGDRQELTLRAFEDVGKIAVFDEQLDEYIDVPAVDIDYAQGLNRQVHKLVTAEARKRFNDDWTQEQLRAVKRDIQSMVDAAIRGKKTKTRKGAAAHMMHDSEAALGNRSNEDQLTRALQAIPVSAPPVALSVDAEDNADGQFDNLEDLPMTEVADVEVK